MLKYTAKRFVYMLLTIWIVVTVTFVLMHSIPGDPFSGNKRLTQQTIKNLNSKYGLDKPLYIQYSLFMKNLVLKGNLGESYTYPGLTVNSIIAQRAPVSAILGVEALFFALILGIAFGIIAAFKRNHWQDYLVMVIAILGVAIPSFVLAALLQYFFSVKLEVLPTSGWGDFIHTILPALSLSLGIIAVYARYMRSSCIDVLGQDYIMTAEAKGVSKVVLVWKHVIRNAIMPAITILGQQLAGIITGTFVIESIFSIPGIGRYFVTSITDRDYPVILGTTIFVAIVYIVCVFCVDILYSLIDPRIRLSSAKKVGGVKMAEISKDEFKIIGCENNNSEEIVRKNITYWQDAWRRLKNNKIAMVSLFVLIAVIMLAIVGPMLRRFGINDVDNSIQNLSPNSTHWFGTDELGRDLWVRVWSGTRASIIIGVIGAIIELVIGALYGGIAGYFGGTVDDIMMRIIEILNSIPYLILVLIVIIVLNNSGIVPLIIAMTLTGWVGMARLVRGQILTIKEQEYVLAAQSLGASPFRIIFKHLLPNVIGVMIVDVTFAVPNYIFAEAFLSYIGLGVKPPNTSLGALCSSGQTNLMFYPYQLLWPSLVICLIMLTFNLLGDGLSEALDPRQRQ